MPVTCFEFVLHRGSLFLGCLYFLFLCSIPVHFFAVRIFTTYSRANVLRSSMSL
jgi:hypothetical protein